VSWALASVRSASVARHATEAPPSNLDEPETAQAGARVYSTIGCVNCHGGPGVGDVNGYVSRREGLGFPAFCFRG
jgi:mono/diheme cytochrome c family protein